MSLGAILLIVVVLMLIGAIQAGPIAEAGVTARAVVWAWFCPSL